MRSRAKPHEVSRRPVRRVVALCALLLGANLVLASSVTAQSSWETVVATAKAAPHKPSTPKRAATAKPAATEKPAATAEPAAILQPTIGPAFATFMARTQLAAQQPTAPSTATAMPTPAPAAAAAQPAKPAAEAAAFSTSAARQFCVNIADAAADAKFAWQRKTLSDIAQELEKRVGMLDEKIAEHRRWVTRRDEFVQKARDSLVLIYSRMRPDAAAMQLMAMDEETAAAVLLKLDPRAAGIILNEMEPARAARLTGTIDGAAKTSPNAAPKSNPEGGKS